MPKKKRRPEGDESLDYKQRKAAFYLAAYDWPKSKVAKEIGVSSRLLNAWLETEEFNAAIDDNVTKLSGVDREFRLDRSKKALPYLYEELLRRLAIDDSELQDVPLKDVMKMISSMTNEIRTDTPGEATQKVGHFNLGNLSKRYMKSTSGEKDGIKKKKKKKSPVREKNILDFQEVRRRHADKKERDRVKETGEEANES